MARLRLVVAPEIAYTAPVTKRVLGLSAICLHVLAGCGGDEASPTGPGTSGEAGASIAASTSGAGASGGTGASGGAGTGAGGVGGVGGAAPTELDLHDATLYDNPPNLADWPVTTKITDLEFQFQGMDGVHVEFDKKDGPESWPDVTPPGWDGPLEYTMGMAEYIDGHWYASAAIQFWRGLEAFGGNVALDNQVAKNWYYDERWGQMNGYQPATGETIGIFVVAGNLRGVTDGSQSPVQERSNVVLVPMPDVAGAKHTF